MCIVRVPEVKQRKKMAQQSVFEKYQLNIPQLKENNKQIQEAQQTPEYKGKHNQVHHSQNSENQR